MKLSASLLATLIILGGLAAIPTATALTPTAIEGLYVSYEQDGTEYVLTFTFPLSPNDPDQDTGTFDYYGHYGTSIDEDDCVTSGSFLGEGDANVGYTTGDGFVTITHTITGSNSWTSEVYFAACADDTAWSDPSCLLQVTGGTNTFEESSCGTMAGAAPSVPSFTVIEDYEDDTVNSDPEGNYTFASTGTSSKVVSSPFYQGSQGWRAPTDDDYAAYTFDSYDFCDGNTLTYYARSDGDSDGAVMGALSNGIRHSPTGYQTGALVIQWTTGSTISVGTTDQTGAFTSDLTIAGQTPDRWYLIEWSEGVCGSTTTAHVNAWDTVTGGQVIDHDLTTTDTEVTSVTTRDTLSFGSLDGDPGSAQIHVDYITAENTGPREVTFGLDSANDDGTGITLRTGESAYLYDNATDRIAYQCSYQRGPNDPNTAACKIMAPGGATAAVASAPSGAGQTNVSAAVNGRGGEWVAVLEVDGEVIQTQTRLVTVASGAATDLTIAFHKGSACPLCDSSYDKLERNERGSAYVTWDLTGSSDYDEIQVLITAPNGAATTYTFTATQTSSDYHTPAFTLTQVGTYGVAAYSLNNAGESVSTSITVLAPGLLDGTQHSIGSLLGIGEDGAGWILGLITVLVVGFALFRIRPEAGVAGTVLGIGAGAVLGWFPWWILILISILSVALLMNRRGGAV